VNAPHDAESTGEIVMYFGPGGMRIDAPARAVIPEHELFGLDRVVVDGRVGIELPGGIRYLIGARRGAWPSRRVLLHRLP
jgi:hypothetical protein